MWKTFMMSVCRAKISRVSEFEKKSLPNVICLLCLGYVLSLAFGLMNYYGFVVLTYVRKLFQSLCLINLSLRTSILVYMSLVMFVQDA